MTDWLKNKNLGSWAFTKAPHKWGYTGNPRWTEQPVFPDQHNPCGYWPDTGPARTQEFSVLGSPFLSKRWEMTAMSATGQYRLLLVRYSDPADTMYVSRDYGLTWTPTGLVRNWYSAFISLSGQFQLASTAYEDRTYLSSDFGLTWTPTSMSRAITSASFSRNGQYIFVAAGGPNLAWRSINYGASWIEVNPGSSGCSYVQVSENGQVMITARNYTYFSNNFGASWTETIGWSGGNTDFAGSLNMQYVLMPGSSLGNPHGHPLISSGFGAPGTWVRRILPPGEGGVVGRHAYPPVAVSHSGQYQALLWFFSDTYTIYVSSDFGTSWTRTQPLQAHWNKLQMSACGQYLSVSATLGQSGVWVSHNYGASWVRSDCPTAFGAVRHLSMNESGRYQMAIFETSPSPPYYSSDYGLTWSTTPQYFYDVSTPKGEQGSINPVWTMPS